MTRDILKAAMAEKERLLCELAKDPLYQRLKAVENIIDLYSAPSEAQEADTGTPPYPAQRNRQSNKSADVVSAAANYLKEIQRRAQTSEIYTVLTSRGIKIGGKRPKSTLASYLSYSPIFDNVQGEGYGLVEWDEQPKSAQNEAPDIFQSGAPKHNGGRSGDLSSSGNERTGPSLAALSSAISAQRGE